MRRRPAGVVSVIAPFNFPLILSIRSIAPALALGNAVVFKPDPRTAVVDARLRVHGTQGLRVADASVFPAVTSANTNAPVIMVGEKASDLILADA